MNYPNEIVFDATSLLETVCPENILIVGESLFDIANQYQEHCYLIKKACTVTHVPVTTGINDSVFMQRYDLAIVCETIEIGNKQASEHLIGRLRDLCSPCIILLANLSNSTWKENELFGFGLSRFDNYEISGENYILYQYNIDSYKRTPDWFNPKSWANPKLWNKFWW